MPPITSREELLREIDNPTSQLKSGVILQGNLELLEMVGVGATAFVWKAYHVTLREYRAVKELKRIFLMKSEKQKQIRERLVEEARIMRRLKHDNIVSVLDVLNEEGEDERCLVIMEWIDGMTLEALIALKGSLTMEQSKNILLALVDALTYAFNKLKAVHRDIKPGNVLLEGDAENFVVRLADFGLAISEIHDRRTKVGTANIGTPMYAAPEQLLDLSSADLRADHYALGITLLEMLTGSPIDLRKPGAWAAFQPNVHPALARLIKKMTNPDREERHSSHEELRAAIVEAFDEAMKPASEPEAEAQTEEAVPPPPPPAMETVTPFTPEEAPPQPTPRPASETILPAPEPDAFADEPQPERKPGRGRTPIVIGAVIALLLGTVGVFTQTDTNDPTPEPQPEPVTKTVAKAVPEPKREEPAAPPPEPAPKPAPVAEKPVVATKGADAAPAMQKPATPIVQKVVEKPTPPVTKTEEPKAAEPRLTADASKDGTRVRVSVKTELCTATMVTVRYRMKGVTDAAYTAEPAALVDGAWVAKIPLLTSGTDYFIDGRTDKGRKYVGSAEEPLSIGP